MLMLRRCWCLVTSFAASLPLSPRSRLVPHRGQARQSLFARRAQAPPSLSSSAIIIAPTRGVATSYFAASASSSLHDDLGVLSVKELKDRLREEGLPVSGRKAELVERLLQQNIMSTRRSSRAASAAAAAKISDAAEDGNDASASAGSSAELTSDVLKGAEKADGGAKASPKKKASPQKKKAAAKKVSSEEEPDEATKKKAAPKKRKGKGSSGDEEKGEDPASEEKKAAAPKKKAKAADHQRWTEVVPLTRHWGPEQRAAEPGGAGYTFTVISWNVAGLRAVVKNRPDALPDLAARYGADVICLQETKLQDGHLDDPKLKLREYFDDRLGGYDAHWSYSIEKKGYSGTAMFIKKRGGGDGGGGGDDGKKKGKKQATLGAFFGSSKGGEDGGDAKAGGADELGDVPASHLRPVSVETELGLPAHDGEGRTITAEFPWAYLTNVYVPNSGQKLDRLGYRTESWDSDFLSKMQELEKGGNKPVIWLGDLNVAHNEKDTWNEGAKHLPKSAGTTPQERASFDRQLGAGYVDAFRHLHPDGRGHYSYWSQRAGNREPNKGLRLDYFICSRALMEGGDGSRARVRDSYMIPDFLGSDHCPIVLEIEIKK